MESAASAGVTAVPLQIRAGLVLRGLLAAPIPAAGGGAVVLTAVVRRRRGGRRGRRLLRRACGRRDVQTPRVERAEVTGCAIDHLQRPAAGQRGAVEPGQRLGGL